MGGFASLMFIVAVINAALAILSPHSAALAIVCALVGASAQISAAIRERPNA
jgi:hypothetical protein